MTGYVERARKERYQQMAREVDNLNEEWVSSWGTSLFKEMTGDKDPESVSLRDLINLQSSSEYNQKRFYSLGRFLLNINSLILEWELVELDENCTIPEALVALKLKDQSL